MMLYAFNQVVLDPEKPVKQFGHSCQTEPVSRVHDSLHGRILGLANSKLYFISVSLDLLGIDYDFTRELTELVQPLFDKPVKVVVSATHNHYGGYTRDKAYRKQCLEAVYEGVQALEFREGKLTASYKSISYQGVGTSRITNHEALVLLNLVQIYDDDREICDIINYNCHPTVMKAEDTDFFTSEYVGYALSQLKEDDREVDFTFLQGAAGDVSTRFTRTGQNYGSVVQLGQRFADKVQWLREQPAKRRPLTLTWKEKEIEIGYDLTDIDTSLLPDNLSKRELYTIELGKEARRELIAHPERWQKSCVLTQLNLGAVKIIFAPNEFFSYYLSVLNTDRAFLVCYSNGYCPYVLPPEEIIYTYETFTDIMSRDTKLQIVETLKEFN
ncbi:MAG: hypothetical protein K6A14_01650 [Erysipelotrichaceae bacterium]|nr:hypothetical protein [Erysipelotrichaceae bacterium]